MSNLNKAQIIGRLGKDPEVKTMPNGNAVSNITVATSEQWKDKQTGERKERTEWHLVTLFGRTAEVAGEYLKKGALVYIEGRLQTRSWEKDGQKHYTTEIICDNLRMLGGKGEKSDAPKARANAPRDDGGAAELDDDIPF